MTTKTVSTLRLCPTCGTSITKKINKFCSLVCANNQPRKKIIKNKPKKNCNNCNIEFEIKKKEQLYCSQSCAAAKNGRLYPKRTKKVFSGTCQRCGLSCNPYRKFCSTNCKLEPIENHFLKDHLTPRLRLYLIDLNMGRCWQCCWEGVNSASGRNPLQVEHIDGNHMNNSKDNLTVLCGSCHSMTPTYGFTGSRSSTRNRKRNQ